MARAVVRGGFLSKAVFGVALWCPPGGQSVEEPQQHSRSESAPHNIVLTKLRATLLGRGESVRGGTWGPNNDLYFWTDRALWVLDSSTAGRAKLCPELQGVLGAGVIAQQFEVITPRAEVFTLQGRRCTRSYSAEVDDLQSVIATANGWFGVLRDSNAVDPVVSWKGRASPRAHSIGLALPAFVRGRSNWLQVSGAAAGGVFVSFRLYPFPWIRLGSPQNPSADTAVGMVFDPMSAPKDYSDTLPRWLALPPLEVGGSVLRLLSDVDGRLRIVQTFDGMGRLVRSRVLREPIGFFAVNNELQLIGAVVGWPVQRVVLYRWRWSRANVKEER